MPLTLPPATQKLLEEYESSTEPTVDYEIARKLSGILGAEGLSTDERKGAWAEATAFNLMLMDESPWHTRYGPIFTATKKDGSPHYAPDIAEIDEEMLNHWEQRSAATQHPLLRARYADVTWELKKVVTGTPASVQLAHRAIDAYLDGVAGGSAISCKRLQCFHALCSYCLPDYGVRRRSLVAGGRPGRSRFR